MADLIGDSNGVFKPAIRKLETTDPRHPDTWNPNYQDLITNAVILKGKQEQQQTEIEGARGGNVDLNGRIVEVENSVTQIEVDAAQLSEQKKDLGAIRAFSSDQLVYDVVVDIPEIPVLTALATDNTVDVEQTDGIEVGQSYFLIEGEIIEEVRVLAVLNSTRLTITTVLSNTFTSAAIFSRKTTGSIITRHCIAPSAVLFISGSSDLEVDVLVDTAGAWEVVNIKGDNGYWITAPGQFKINITTGDVEQIGVRHALILPDQEDGVIGQYIIEIIDGNIVTRSV